MKWHADLTIDDVHGMALELNSAWDVWPGSRTCAQCGAFNDYADDLGYFCVALPDDNIPGYREPRRYGAVCGACWTAGGYRAAER